MTQITEQRRGASTFRAGAIFTDDRPGSRIDVVDLAAREAGYWLVDVLVLGDIFGAKALDAVSGLGAAVEEERHKTQRLLNVSGLC